MNEKNVINILIAVPERDSRLFTEQLKGTLKENPYFQVLHFYTVHTLEQINSYVEQRKVDVVICAEDLGYENMIGQGSIKRWKQNDERVRVVLLMFDEKRKGTKVSNFIKNGYYDAIFLSDLSPEILIDVIVKGRTEEEANKYYFSDAENELVQMENDEQEEELFISVDENVEEMMLEEPEEETLMQEQQEPNELVEEVVEKNNKQIMPEDVNIHKEKEAWEEREGKEKSVQPNIQKVKKKKEEPSVRPNNSMVPASACGINTYMGSIKATVDTKGMLLYLDSALEDIGELEGCRVLINIFRE